jgi:predicted transposase
MKQLITAKLKLHTDKAQFAALRQTQLAYRDALNYVSHYAFEHGKMSSGRALQRETYDEIRLRFGLPAQMACNVPRQVGASYKTLWTKLKQNAAACQAGLTRKRYKGLDQPPKYVSPTLTYNYHRDYSLKPEAQVSILTLQGRMVVPYTDGRDADTEVTGEFGIADSRQCCRLFITHVHKTNAVLSLAQRLEEAINTITGQAEHCIDPQARRRSSSTSQVVCTINSPLPTRV